MRAVLEILGNAANAKKEAKRRGITTTLERVIPANEYLQSVGIKQATLLRVNEAEKVGPALAAWFGEAQRLMQDGGTPVGGELANVGWTDDTGTLPVRPPCNRCGKVLAENGSGHDASCERATLADRVKLPAAL